MDIGSIDPNFQKQTQRHQSKQDASDTFKQALVSKINLQAGSIQAAEQMQEPSLMKARRKSIQNDVEEESEEDSVLKTIQDIKKRLKAIRKMERNALGI